MTAVLLAVTAPAVAAEEQKTLDDYRVIYERNMFSRDRRPPETNRRRPTRTTTQVLEIYVLRGIAAQKDERVAFIEEQVSGQTTKARIGNEVLGGTITEIQPNRVAFDDSGQTKYIQIGGEFGKTETTVVSTVSEEESQQTASTQTQTQQPADSGASADESEILRRLRERRQSELGQ
jgi:hypothetical protein